MIKKDVKITIPTGLQLDAAGEFCDIAMKYDCKVHFLYRGENESNAKSVLSILGAGIRNNETITLTCDGADEAAAMAELLDYFSGGK